MKIKNKLNNFIERVLDSELHIVGRVALIASVILGIYLMNNFFEYSSWINEGTHIVILLLAVLFFVALTLFLFWLFIIGALFGVYYIISLVKWLICSTGLSYSPEELFINFHERVYVVISFIYLLFFGTWYLGRD